MNIDPNILSRMDRFKDDLNSLADSMMVQKYITYGDCHILSDDTYFKLKSEIANKFGIHPTEVVIVGSGKLGFSIAPNKRFLPFGDNSDIDIAIISPTLFDRIWIDVFDYWKEISYWPGEREFREYLFRGWIRPDKLPPANRFEWRRVWWDFFRELGGLGIYGPYKLRAGIYKSWHFLESYQVTSIKGCRDHPEG